MSMSGVYELLLRGLEGKADPNTLSYVSREAAYEELKELTGQDFGFGRSQPGRLDSTAKGKRS